MLTSSTRRVAFEPAVSQSLLDAYRPSLIPLLPNLRAAVFPLMKIYPAHKCITRALQEGVIDQDSLVIETSSGTMALGLAVVCRWAGLALSIVGDLSCDEIVRTRLQALGATVDIVTSPAPVGGYQRARLDRVERIRASRRNAWCVDQYGNPANPDAYSSFAGQLIEAIGPIDCLVGTVGSGGSMCGTAGYLRVLYPTMRVVGVDTFNSVLFGQPDGPRPLRGLGNSLQPRNLDHTVFDEIHWVSAPAAFLATRMLHAETTLFRGPTSGACWLVASHWARENPDATVVCLFADDGYRYLDTVYNSAYLRANNLWADVLPASPQVVTTPAEASGVDWATMPWNRRPRP